MTNLGRLWVLVSLPLVSAVACGSDDGGSDGNAEDSSSSSGGGDDSGTGASATASTTASTSASTTASTSASTGPGEESSGGSEESSSADGSSSGTTGASVPAVVETTPADGAVGVFADTSLVVRFSEAMDADSVLAAYQSDDVPVDAVTVTWNDTADEVSFTPIAPLQYATGDDPDAFGPLSYAFTIDATATSAQGVPLEAPVTVTFSTLRRVSQSFATDDTRTGALGSDGQLPANTFLGDTNTDTIRRYAVSFDLTTLVPDVAQIESAQFHASWSGQSGDPWAALGGGTVMQHVSFDELTAAAYDAEAIGDPILLFGGAGDTEVSRDVAEPLQAVLDDLDGFGTRLQLRARWLVESDDDNAYDGVSLVAGMTLDTTVLAP
ncbi:MAG: Ig-like domain-containing protein [Nannocystaceae bacterium]|nr:Ig-like domain-containing protein [Nannocystaceae bacterium]